jgi:hypothetical protein
MLREYEHQPKRWPCDDFAASVPIVRKSPKSPHAPILNLLRLHRIIVDVLEYIDEVLQARDYPREKPAPPDMAGKSSYSIEGHREHAQDPSHDHREAFTSPWLYNEMEMISHYAEILDLKIVFSFSPSHYR